MKFKKRSRILFALSLLGLSACNEFTSDLRVVPRSADAGNLTLKTEKGRLELVPGVYPVRVTLSEKQDQPSTLVFTDKKKGEVKVSLQLPLPETARNSLEPIDISPEKLGQPVRLTLVREVDSGQDRINIAFSDPKSGDIVALAQIFHKTEEPDYEKNTGDFLRSYQRVKFSQRGAYIPIDGGNGDSLANNSARVLLAPWVYASYNQVEWRVASEDLTFLDPRIEESQTIAHWASLLRQNSVVDYFAFLRGENEAQEADPLYFLPKKRNQLRLAYSDNGATGSSLRFIRDFNAAFAAGQTSVASSPLFGFTSFGFTLVRSWTLGMNGSSSLLRAYKEAKSRESSTATEPLESMFSWTQELAWEKAGISYSAVPTRNTEELTRIYEAKVSDLESDDLSSKPAQENAPQESGYNVCSLRDLLAPHAFEDRKSVASAATSLVSKESAEQGAELDIHRLRLDQLALYEKAIDAKGCDRKTDPAAIAKQ